MSSSFFRHLLSTTGRLRTVRASEWMKLVVGVLGSHRLQDGHWRSCVRPVGVVVDGRRSARVDGRRDSVVDRSAAGAAASPARLPQWHRRQPVRVHVDHVEHGQRQQQRRRRRRWWWWWRRRHAVHRVARLTLTASRDTSLSVSPVVGISYWTYELNLRVTWTRTQPVRMLHWILCFQELVHACPYECERSLSSGVAGAITGVDNRRNEVSGRKWAYRTLRSG